MDSRAGWGPRDLTSGSALPPRTPPGPPHTLQPNLPPGGASPSSTCPLSLGQCEPSPSPTHPPPLPEATGTPRAGRDLSSGPARPRTPVLLKGRLQAEGSRPQPPRGPWLRAGQAGAPVGGDRLSSHLVQVLSWGGREWGASTPTRSGMLVVLLHRLEGRGRTEPYSPDDWPWVPLTPPPTPVPSPRGAQVSGLLAWPAVR